jgi:hypothetical protein
VREKCSSDLTSATIGFAAARKDIHKLTLIIKPVDELTELINDLQEERLISAGLSAQLRPN